MSSQSKKSAGGNHVTLDSVTLIENGADNSEDSLDSRKSLKSKQKMDQRQQMKQRQPDNQANDRLTNNNNNLTNGNLAGNNLAKGNFAGSNQLPDQPTGKAAKKKTPIKKSEIKISTEDLSRINTNKGLLTLLRSRDIRLKDVLEEIKYEDELEKLQVELVKLQRWVQTEGKRIAIIFEGRDAAGKGGTIRRFAEHLNPRSIRVVALPKPSEAEKGQWYFQRYSIQLPNRGEIVFFDRSWYNRAVVEPVMGFCSKSEYQRFMQQVPEYEHMLYEDGITLIKFWFSISKEEQQKRFESRKTNMLKQWKLSPIDQQAQEKWDSYTQYKEEMFSKTHTSYSPWILVKANNKQKARLESIRYVLNSLPYDDKDDRAISLYPDPNVVMRFHRNIIKID